MIDHRVVAARLAAMRITRAVGPLDGALAHHYRTWHAELTQGLAKRFGNLEPAELFVTCTANAQSELLCGAGSCTIVHDRHLGRTLNRMTYFVVRDWPASRVQAWAFERLAIAALSRGDLHATQLALALSSHLANVDEAPAENAALDVRGPLWSPSRSSSSLRTRSPTLRWALRRTRTSRGIWATSWISP